MENLRQVFINNLRRYRKARNLRQLDLALEIGRSPNYINSIENGKYFPSPETIEQIADFLGVEPMLLFSRKSENLSVASEDADIAREIQLFQKYRPLIAKMETLPKNAQECLDFFVDKMGE